MAYIQGLTLYYYYLLRDLEPKSSAFPKFLNIFHVVLGANKRCFACRSRGELGSCKDPFTLNSTLVKDERGVEAQPCASGWCGKIIESETAFKEGKSTLMCRRDGHVSKLQSPGETVNDFFSFRIWISNTTYVFTTWSIR